MHKQNSEKVIARENSKKLFGGVGIANHEGGMMIKYHKKLIIRYSIPRIAYSAIAGISESISVGPYGSSCANTISAGHKKDFDKSCQSKGLSVLVKKKPLCHLQK